MKHGKQFLLGRLRGMEVVLPHCGVRARKPAENASRNIRSPDTIATAPHPRDLEPDVHQLLPATERARPAAEIDVTLPGPANDRRQFRHPRHKESHP